MKIVNQLATATLLTATSTQVMATVPTPPPMSVSEPGVLPLLAVGVVVMAVTQYIKNKK